MLPRIASVLLAVFCVAACAAVVVGVFLHAHPAGADGEAEAGAPAGGVSVATFNIEYYPQSEAQADKAVDVIGGLGAVVVGLQGITDPAHLQRHMQTRVKASWRVVAATHPYATALLYDGDEVELLSSREIDETVTAPRLIPSLEGRFRLRDGSVLRVIVLHLKAADNFPTRKAQLDALEPVLQAARRSGDALVVLGDWNSTSDADRRRIAALARSLDLHWATEDLSCTCFWRRDDDCVGSRLDHALTSERPARVDVAGACADGCAAAERCPAWREEVSDHCPVVVGFPGAQ